METKIENQGLEGNVGMKTPEQRMETVKRDCDKAIGLFDERISNFNLLAVAIKHFGVDLSIPSFQKKCKDITADFKQISEEIKGCEQSLEKHGQPKLAEKLRQI